jgi:hypothetical protein
MQMIAGTFLHLRRDLGRGRKPARDVRASLPRDIRPYLEFVGRLNMH